MEFEQQFEAIVNLIKSQDPVSPSLNENNTREWLVRRLFETCLGFSVTEVRGEYDAGWEKQKAEKVDYAIFRDDQPLMIIECKALGNLLPEHRGQLSSYFGATRQKDEFQHARIAIITDGNQYLFYSDFNKRNVLDEKPYFEIELKNASFEKRQQLLQYTKNNFDTKSILEAAKAEIARQRLSLRVQNYLQREFESPSHELIIRIMESIKYASGGNWTANRTDQLRPLVKEAMNEFIVNQAKSKLDSLSPSDDLANRVSRPNPELVSERQASLAKTSENEMEAYISIKLILRQIIDTKRIFMRDGETYCAIIIDDNNRNKVARLYFTDTRLRLGIFDQNDVETRFDLTSLDDIFKHESQLRLAVAKYV
jgi:hypothetical protein